MEIRKMEGDMKANHLQHWTAAMGEEGLKQHAKAEGKWTTSIFQRLRNIQQRKVLVVSKQRITAT